MRTNSTLNRLRIERKSKMQEASIDDITNQFKIGEIVWAKVRGFPWWPAKVSSAKIDLTSKSGRH